MDVLILTVTCTCDANWGGPTCGGMDLCINKGSMKEIMKERKKNTTHTL